MSETLVGTVRGPHPQHLPEWVADCYPTLNRAQLGGPPTLQMTEPEGHALGRSQGGFGTKTHLVCDSGGILLAVWGTAGQRHELKGFAEVMQRARRPRQPGRKRWPEQAADKGYSFAWVRSWLWRHHIQPVIPTRKDQPRPEDFDSDTYRRRNSIERVVGWFKWCRALTTRFDKLAVNYVALWLVATIQYLLRNYLEAVRPGLSETTSPKGARPGSGRKVTGMPTGPCGAGGRTRSRVSPGSRANALGYSPSLRG